MNSTNLANSLTEAAEAKEREEYFGHFAVEKDCLYGTIVKGMK